MTTGEGDLNQRIAAELVTRAQNSDQARDVKRRCRTDRDVERRVGRAGVDHRDARGDRGVRQETGGDQCGAFIVIGPRDELPIAIGLGRERGQRTCERRWLDGAVLAQDQLKCRMVVQLGERLGQNGRPGPEVMRQRTPLTSSLPSGLRTSMWKLCSIVAPLSERAVIFTTCAPLRRLRGGQWKA